MRWKSLLLRSHMLIAWWVCSYRNSTRWVTIQDQRQWLCVSATFVCESLCDTLHKPISSLSGERRKKSCFHTWLLGGSCADTSTFLCIYCHFSIVPRWLSATVVAQRVAEKWGEKLATRSVTRYTWKTRCRHQLSLVLYHRHISDDVQSEPHFTSSHNIVHELHEEFTE
jgi:hypothetical protein